MSVKAAAAQIHSAVMQWPGVTSSPHRFGGTEYHLGKRELGHIHGDHMVDIPFPTSIRNEVVQAGLAESHHILPESGWVSLYLRHPDDIERAISLLRRSFELAQAKYTPTPSNS